MGFGKFLLGGLCAVGAIVAAPIVLPAAAVIGTGVAATGVTIGATAAGVTIGTAAAATAASVATAAATAGTTATTTVGAAGAGAMASVGTTGIVGLTSGAVGAASAVSGASKMSQASDLSDEAKYISNRAKEKFDSVENDTTKCLESLGILKLEIWEGFERYQNAFIKIKNFEDWGDLKTDEAFKFDINELNDIKLMAISAKDIVKGAALSFGAGQLVSIATTYSRTSVAALGGGSLSTSGLGMAGGMMIPNAIIAGPALAVGGLFINSKGNKSLNAAKDAYRESEIYVDNLETASIELEKLGDLSLKLIDELNKYRSTYDKWMDWLEKQVENEADFSKYSTDQKKRLFISGQITSILKNLTLTQLITDDQDVEKKVCEESVSKAIKNANNEIKSLEVKHNITI